MSNPLRCRAAVFVAILGLSACSRSRGETVPICVGEFATGVVVKLSDARTGDPIPHATLILTAGGSKETMQMVSESPEAIYTGAIDRAGTFDLSISAAGYGSQTRSGIEVVWIGCRLDTQTLEVALEPVPAAETEVEWVVFAIGPEGVEVRRLVVLEGFSH